MAHYDVIIVGLGAMGSAAAHHLAARGTRVLGLEQYGPVHDRGSSHGGSRIIRQASFEDPAYVPLALRSYELWKALERDTGHNLVSLTGGLVLGRPEGRAVEGTLRSARLWGIPHDVLDTRDIKRRFPTFTPSPREVAVYEPSAGYARSEATVTAQRELAARHRATLRFHERVTTWEALSAGSGVRVHTSDSIHTATRLVVCPGAWAPEVLADLGLRFRVKRQVQYWFRPRNAAAFATTHPVYIWDDDVQLHGFPAHDGPEMGAKVAFTSAESASTPEDMDHTVSESEIDWVRDRVSAKIPALPEQFLHASVCRYTNTHDGHFVVAHHPEHSQVTVACGFSGNDFTFVPVIGEILADLATEGVTEYPVGLFDPRRLIPHAA